MSEIHPSLPAKLMALAAKRVLHNRAAVPLDVYEALVNVAGAAEGVTDEKLCARGEAYPALHNALAELQRLVDRLCPPTADDSSATRTMPVEVPRD
jgi:hypothetical protein